MKTILDLILKHYSYIVEEKIQSSHVSFYKHKNKDIASYFIINNIDCRKFECDGEAMKVELETLERKYSTPSNSQTESIKLKIQKSFDNNKEASQVDKNTSAIYLIQFNDLKNLKLHRNLVYAIEESPNYFKRYIIPYTEEQVIQLKKILGDYDGRGIDYILSDIANDENEYYKLLEGKNTGSVYEFVICLFSKIPFLQYKFKADSIPLSIENDILQKVKGNLEKYHSAIQNKECTLERLLELENDLTIDDKILDKELNRLLGGAI